jgi:hypothetical protein
MMFCQDRLGTNVTNTQTKLNEDGVSHNVMLSTTGYGHGITNPKSQRAVLSHNKDWFGHYVFGDPEPNLGLLGGATSAPSAKL